MKHIIALILLLIIIDRVNAAVPTMEGLFRSSSNKNISGDTVFAKILIKKELPQLYKSIDEVHQHSTNLEVNEVYLKVIFHLNKDTAPKMILASYTNGAMNKNSLAKVSYVDNLNYRISNDSIAERKFLFSLLSMLFMNKSDNITRLIKEADPGFLLNEEVMEEKKVSFLTEWKERLLEEEERKEEKEEKREKEGKEEKDPESYNKEFENYPLYKRSPNVTLIRIGRDFFWKIQLKYLSALFGNKSHQFKEITLNFPNGRFHTYAENSTKFGSTYYLPKVTFVEMPKGEKFSLRILSIKNFKSSQSVEKRLNDFHKNKKQFIKVQQEQKFIVEKNHSSFYLY